ncbi:class I SAM-dependent methyltransferase [Actinopolyspora erythraea]|uniref:class I SAM-dependent methyltransferase n=1 Tax=Actinopolyspora erythraea TaxID=414996 RepID=UPI0006947261|nr:methyltransferase domain-containing protein [Actinopolyspora erythraea]
MGEYIFASDDRLTEIHLGALDRAFDRISIQRLLDSGVGPGWRCLDVGAGSGSLASWLARRVGRSGEVVATDVDLRGLRHVAGSNLRVLEHDITVDALSRGSYDLVHGRLLLILLQRRRELLEPLVRALKPGGVLLMEDFDVEGAGTVCAPSAAEGELFDRVLWSYLDAMSAAGADIHWGRHLYGELCRIGLRDVSSVGTAEVWRGGSPGCELIQANFTQLRERMLAEGRVDPDELRRATELLGDPRFAMRGFLLVGNSGIR